MSDENQIPQQQFQTPQQQKPNAPRQGHVSCQQVSAKAFAAKFKSKRECYTFLAGECEVYLPPYGKFGFLSILIFMFPPDNVTIYFLKDILARRKAYIHNDKVKTLHVPQYKNLSIEKILEFVIDKPYMFMYFPDEIDMPKVPKQWLVNAIAAVLGEQFKGWVTK